MTATTSQELGRNQHFAPQYPPTHNGVVQLCRFYQAIPILTIHQLLILYQLRAIREICYFGEYRQTAASESGS